MSNQIYPKWLDHVLESFLLGTGPATEYTVNLAAVGVSAAYAFDANHDTYADIESYTLFSPVPMSNVTVNNGVIDADDTLLTLTDSIGETMAAVIILAAWDEGAYCVAYLDTVESGDLPFIISEGDFLLRWNSSGILRI